MTQAATPAPAGAAGSGLFQNDLVHAFGLTIGELFDDAVALWPERIAVQDKTGCWTYAELRDTAHRYAALLLAHGVRAGERVAMLSENRREYVALLLAGAKLGVPIVCLNWRQAPEELERCVRLVTPRLALVSARFAGLEVFGSVARVLQLGAQFDALIADQSADVPAVATPEPESILYILFTSGTTGVPKGACISHRALVARGAIGLMDGAQRRGATYIAWPPFFHMASADTSLNVLSYGGKVIVMDGVPMDQLCHLLTTEENLGWVNLMPGMIDEVMAAMRVRGLTPRRVDSIGSLPDLMPRARIAESTAFFNAPYRNSYGSTETGPAPCGAGFLPIGIVPDDAILAKQQSSLCRVRLVDPEGRDVVPGERGELWFRGPTLFSGYWGMPQESAAALAGGWYRTGDVFVRDAAGRLRFVDRRKYLIKSGGENIYPAEIEQLLTASPRVVDAAVVRKRHERWGEVPVAFVVRRDPTLDAEGVLALCRGRIAKYKLPSEVRFVEALPRNVTGKVARDVLEQAAAALLE